MGKPKAENVNKNSVSVSTTEVTSSSKNKQTAVRKKRKRLSSASSSNDGEIILPENALETERTVHASAVKNNLDETSVRKIIKKVVTNDHVLALVKLREEEEDARTDDKKLQPKLTRAKVKELKKVSPRTTAWNLEDLELTPIKHIPVKTRPEVKALIAQELPEDEDDEEYDPTHDAVSEDEPTLESCSDLESQPRTPATPATVQSPATRLDGPFKVPQDVSKVCRKLDVEEATIALRTRSKLSLSATSIEHIESTFVPPDDIPIPDVDDLWSEFLDGCLNPASNSKHEDDDEADPEYNVAADPDANDEDEEALGNSIIKISKKELNDLVTELFNIMPATDEDLAENLANSVLTDNSNTEVTQWVTKQEPVSDDEIEKPSKRLQFEKRDTYTRVSIGKNEPEDPEYEVIEQNEQCGEIAHNEKENQPEMESKKADNTNKWSRLTVDGSTPKVQMRIEERSIEWGEDSAGAPPSLRPAITPTTQTLRIEIEPVTMTADQRLILEQQLRQHVQLATSNFLQLFIHPLNWKLAPSYKEYLESLVSLCHKTKDSIANVCNLKPAIELVQAWEQTVSQDTAENRQMIEFYSKFSIPGIIGCIDGTHISIIKPAVDEEQYYCRKGYHSLNVMIICDADMNILCVDPSSPGRTHDSVIWRDHPLNNHLTHLPDTETSFLLGDSGYSLRKTLLTPILNTADGSPEQYYYNAHVRTRNVVERTIGVLKSRFRFIQGQLERSRRRAAHNCLYAGDFHETFMKVVANSPVFLYPSLLPPMPYRPDKNRRFYYLPSENVLIVLGLDQFRQHITSNESHYKRAHSRGGATLSTTLQLVARHMMPWTTAKTLACHVKAVNHTKNEANPIYRYFKFNEIPKTKHVLLPYNPRHTMYDQPEHEIPKIWVRFLAKTNSRFKNYLYKRKTCLGMSSEAVVLNTNNLSECHTTLPPVFTRNSTLSENASEYKIIVAKDDMQEAPDENSLHMGADIKTVDSNDRPITTTREELNGDISDPDMTTVSKVNSEYKTRSKSKAAKAKHSKSKARTKYAIKSKIKCKSRAETNKFAGSCKKEVVNPKSRTEEHCTCCVALKNIVKEKQTCITDYFGTNSRRKKCDCDKTYPKITNKLKLLVRNHKDKSRVNFDEIKRRLENLEMNADDCESEQCNAKEIAFVLSYQIKLFTKASISRRLYAKKTLFNLLSKFDLDSDPTALAKRIFKACSVDLVDLYLDFLGFLTPEQADLLGGFKTYFTRFCVEDLMDRIEEQVKDPNAKHGMLSQIKSVYTASKSSSCDICTGLLSSMANHPRLAKYTFDMFPHIKADRSISTESGSNDVLQTNMVDVPDDIVRTFADYEADMSSCDEESEGAVSELSQPAGTEQQLTIDTDKITGIKLEPVEFTLEITETTVAKGNMQDVDETSSYIWEPHIKTEPPDWTRHEDKIILIGLQDNLSCDERRGKTFPNIIELLEKKNAFTLLKEKLTNRTIEEIKERLLYLSSLLVKSVK